MRFRTEIIASEVIFLGGIQQSNLPPGYGVELADLPGADASDDQSFAHDQQSPTDG